MVYFNGGADYMFVWSTFFFFFFFNEAHREFAKEILLTEEVVSLDLTATIYK